MIDFPHETYRQHQNENQWVVGVQPDRHVVFGIILQVLQDIQDVLQLPIRLNVV